MKDEVIALNMSKDVIHQINSHLVADAKQFDSLRRSETTQSLGAILNQPHKVLNDIE